MSGFGQKESFNGQAAGVIALCCGEKSSVLSRPASGIASIAGLPKRARLRQVQNHHPTLNPKP